MTALRAIPDLTLAILCVIGIGAGAGTLALSIYYAAAISKMLGDLFVTAPQRPVEALTATGASRLQIAFYGLLPLTRSDLLSCGSYEFESAIRTSVIIGAGGIGQALYNARQLFFHQTMMAYVLVTWLPAMGFDALNTRLRPSYGLERGALA